MPAGKGSGNYGSIEVFWDDLRIANIGEIDRKTVHATVLIDKTNYSFVVVKLFCNTTT